MSLFEFRACLKIMGIEQRSTPIKGGMSYQYFKSDTPLLIVDITDRYNELQMQQIRGGIIGDLRKKLGLTR